LESEVGLRATFFVIPFENRPGQSSDGPAPKFRAAGYAARESADTMGNLTSRGCEVGLHGIDAWLDSVRGRAQLAEVRRLTGASEIGVRMHWRYYNQQSPAAMESGDSSYDSP